MQNQNNRNCKTCGRPITSRDKRQQYCDRLCYFGGESKIDYLKRMASAAVPGVCLEWPFARNDGGYGLIAPTTTGECNSHLVHRVSYKLFVGPLADDECVLHHCDRPPCFNPHCLFPGSQDDNIEDMDRKGRRAAGMMLPKCKLTPEQVQDIKDRWIPHTNAGLLAREYGIDTKYVRVVAKSLAQKHLFQGTPEELAERQKSQTTRLTAAQREDIKARWIPHSNSAQLALEYNISRESVWRIATQK